jgi:hypothetical protein
MAEKFRLRSIEDNLKFLARNYSQFSKRVSGKVNEFDGCELSKKQSGTNNLQVQ